MEPIGFRMHEAMRGSHRLLRAMGELSAGSEWPFSFEVSWGHPQLSRFLNPLGPEFGVAEMEGMVSAGGLCERVPLEGTLTFRYIPEGRVHYRFDFGEGERRYRFEGSKRDIRPWNLHRTHTTLRGEVRAAGTGTLVSEALLRFDLQELPALLGSFRLV